MNILDIDLDAALNKISQRQTLNQVHYLVQLVRDALTRAPSLIRIEQNEDQLLVYHDGAAMGDDEWLLLHATTKSHEPSKRTQALSELEDRMGVALLSMCLSENPAKIQSGNFIMHARDGVPSFSSLSSAYAGFELNLTRPAKWASEEREALVYYCSRSDVPIYLNGTTLDPSQDDVACILGATQTDESGAVDTGLLSEGTVSRTSYFKQGIRFGVKYGQSSDGSITASTWNSHYLSFEPHFSHSIKTGDHAIGSLVGHLYRNIPDYYDDLAIDEQERVRNLLIRFRIPAWEKIFGKLKLFDMGTQPRQLSLKDLRRLQKNFGYLPFQSHDHAILDLPTLNRDEIAFLRRLGFNLRDVPARAHPLRPNRRDRTCWVSQLEQAGIYTVEELAAIAERLETKPI